MRWRPLHVVGAMAFAIAAAPCRADGPAPYPYPEPVPAPVLVAVPLTYDWTGFYVGGQIGGAYTQGQFNHNDVAEQLCQRFSSSAVSNGSIVCTLRDDAETFIAGGMLGYQKQLGRVLIGAEVSYSWLGAHGSTSSELVPGVRVKTEVNDLFLATAKLGYTQMELMAYAKAGYAAGNVDFRTSGGTSSLTPSSTSGLGEGWTAGLGIDWALRPHIILGIEYDYAHLAASERVQDGLRFTSLGFDIQTVMVRLAYKFGVREELVPGPPVR
jgi:outer membrane immunogenic protein